MINLLLEYTNSIDCQQHQRILCRHKAKKNVNNQVFSRQNLISASTGKL